MPAGRKCPHLPFCKLRYFRPWRLLLVSHIPLFEKRALWPSNADFASWRNAHVPLYVHSAFSTLKSYYMAHISHFLKSVLCGLLIQILRVGDILMYQLRNLSSFRLLSQPYLLRFSEMLQTKSTITLELFCLAIVHSGVVALKSYYKPQTPRFYYLVP